MRALIESLCSDLCAGRATGTPGGIAARAEVVGALRAAGLDPFEQAIPSCNGSNVLAPVSGESDRWVLVAAHYDHLGQANGQTYRGADDNAAAVAILVEVANGIARRRPKGRGVLFAAFDAEEPPHFLSASMGSEHFARHPTIPLDKIDMMVCMDLVGHAVGGDHLPEAVSKSVLALGAERSAGTSAVVDALADSVPGVHVRRLDAEVIPVVSDYGPFWQRQIPFLFLTNGRSSRYHTPRDTPDHLDYAKIAATSQWLETFIRATCDGSERPARFQSSVRDDASTLRSIVAITSALEALDPRATLAREMAADLLKSCDTDCRLPEARRQEPPSLIAMIESALQ